MITGKQKVFPAKCLGCGTKHNSNVYDNNMMQGSDGKFYKVDLRSTTGDPKEVFGVTASQIALYESGKKKYTPTPAKKSSLRPMSAHRM